MWPPAGIIFEPIFPVFIALVILCVFCYLISLFALIPVIKEQAQQERSFRKTVTFILSALVWVCVFFIITLFVTDTSYSSLPHGVDFGIAEGEDQNGVMTGTAVLIDKTTNQEFDVTSSILPEISAERLQRYLLPPFLREHCYTENAFACKWADIDIKSFADVAEWFEYATRIGIGLLSGIMTGLLAWSHTKSEKETLA